MDVMANCSGGTDCSHLGEVSDNMEEVALNWNYPTQAREDLIVRVNCSREEGDEKQLVCLLLDPIPFDPIPTQSSQENRFTNMLL